MLNLALPRVRAAQTARVLARLIAGFRHPHTRGNVPDERHEPTMWILHGR